MTPYQLFTIGYEGRSIEEFVARLRSFHITRLIDVREIPLSRKKGFSKTALREILASEDIEYVHIKSLDSPTKMRQKLKEDWDYERFFDDYTDYLSHHMEGVGEAHKFLSYGVNCIMCFEKHPHQCHRQTVAEKIKECDGNGMKIEHI